MAKNGTAPRELSKPANLLETKLARKSQIANAKLKIIPRGE
jgi:hypothetical protein